MASSSATVGSLKVDLSLNTAQFQNGVKKVQSSLGGLSSAFKSFAAGAAAALSLGAITKALTSAVDAMDELSKSAQKVGVSVEALSKLQYAAKLSDVSTEQLNVSLEKLSKNLAEVASGGTGPAANAFTAFGIAVKNADGSVKDAGTVTQELAAKFATFRDGATKTADAMIFFGKSGADMIPLLNSGKEGIKAAADELERFGGVVSTSAAQASEHFNDNLTRIATAASDLSIQFATKLLPSINAVVDEFIVWFTKVDYSTWFDGLSAFIVNTTKEVNALLGLINNLSTAQDVVANPNINTVTALGAGITVNRPDVTGSTVSAPGKTNLGGAQQSEAPIVALGNNAAKAAPKVKYLKEQIDASELAAQKLNQGVLNLSASFPDLTDTAAEAASQIEDTLTGAFQDWIGQAIDGTFKLKDALGGLLKALTDIALSDAFTMLKGAGGGNPLYGGGGGLSGIISSLFGFAKGGTIMPGGSGGIDSQLVAFRKSPNERVDISKPGQSISGGSPPTYIIDQRKNAPPIQQQRSADGTLKFWVRDAVNEIIGSGQADSSLQSRFGATPTKTRR